MCDEALGVCFMALYVRQPKKMISEENSTPQKELHPKKNFIRL